MAYSIWRKSPTAHFGVGSVEKNRCDAGVSVEVELAALQNFGSQQCFIMPVFYRNAPDPALTGLWMHVIVVSIDERKRSYSNVVSNRRNHGLRQKMCFLQGLRGAQETSLSSLYDRARQLFLSGPTFRESRTYRGGCWVSGARFRSIVRLKSDAASWRELQSRIDPRDKRRRGAASCT